MTTRALANTVFLLGVVAILSFGIPAAAQSPAPRAAIDVNGPITMTYQGGLEYDPTQLRLFGGVDVVSADFEMTADTVTAHLVPSAAKNAAPAYDEIDAVADLPAGRQVTGWFEQYDLGRKYRVTADQAAYHPAAAAKAGGPVGTAVFSGHVTLTVSAPEALAKPMVLQTERLTVVLGPAHSTEYPMIQSTPGKITLTPLQ